VDVGRVPCRRAATDGCTRVERGGGPAQGCHLRQKVGVIRDGYDGKESPGRVMSKAPGELCLRPRESYV
jgi:hypothetical protein